VISQARVPLNAPLLLDSSCDPAYYFQVSHGFMDCTREQLKVDASSFEMRRQLRKVALSLVGIDSVFCILLGMSSFWSRAMVFLLPAGYTEQ
jgi:hypothetical protein